MDKTWIQKPRNIIKYSQGVTKFLDFAFEKASHDGKILCPCEDCGNSLWKTRNIVEEHLMFRGGLIGYTDWLYHGESVSSSTETPVAVQQTSLQRSSACESSDLKGEVFSESLGKEHAGRVRGLGLGPTPFQVFCSCNNPRTKHSAEVQELKRKVDEMAKKMQERDEKMDKRMRKMEQEMQEMDEKMEKRMKKMDEEMKSLRQLVNSYKSLNPTQANDKNTNPQASSSQDVSSSINVNNDMN